MEIGVCFLICCIYLYRIPTLWAQPIFTLSHLSQEHPFIGNENALCRQLRTSLVSQLGRRMLNHGQEYENCELSIVAVISSEELRGGVRGAILNRSMMSCLQLSSTSTHLRSHAQL